MDWTVFHALNHLTRGHDGAQDVVEAFGTWSVPLYAAATVLLWFLARPGGSPRFKLAAGSALASAALALGVNQVIGDLWFRARPFAAHPAATLVLGGRSHDPSFPSDHASAAFAIAFAVLVFSRRLGALFLTAAVLIAVSRIFLGAHYPGDVAAGALVGLVSAWLVTTVGRAPMRLLVGLVSRISDPLLAPVWKRLAWGNPWFPHGPPP